MAAVAGGKSSRPWQAFVPARGGRVKRQTCTRRRPRPSKGRARPAGSAPADGPCQQGQPPPGAGRPSPRPPLQRSGGRGGQAALESGSCGRSALGRRDAAQSASCGPHEHQAAAWDGLRRAASARSGRAARLPAQRRSWPGPRRWRRPPGGGTWGGCGSVCAGGQERHACMRACGCGGCRALPPTAEPCRCPPILCAQPPAGRRAPLASRSTASSVMAAASRARQPSAVAAFISVQPSPPPNCSYTCWRAEPGGNRRQQPRGMAPLKSVRARARGGGGSGGSSAGGRPASPPTANTAPGPPSSSAT